MDDETPEEKRERLRGRLSYEQRLFCELFVKCCDAGEAYREAYGTSSERRAEVLLGRWYIQDYLRALHETGAVDEMVTNKTEVLAHLASIMRDGAEDKDRIAAAKVIAGIQGYLLKRVEHSGDAANPVRVLRGLDREQVLELRATFLGIDRAALEAAE